MWKKIKESIVDIVQARTDELKRRVNDARVADLERRLFHITTQCSDAHNLLDVYYLKDHKVREALGAKAFETTNAAARRVVRELNEAKAKTVAVESECRKARDELAEANKEIIRLKVEYALKRIDPHGLLKISNKEVIDTFDSAAKKRCQEGGTSREANCAGAIAVAAMVTELALVAQRNPEPTSTLEKVEVK
jgi:hypothetical protein